MYVGMLEGVKHITGVRKMLHIAQRVLGFDILEACTHGPPERLADPSVAQPVCHFTVSLETNPERAGVAPLSWSKASKNQPL